MAPQTEEKSYFVKRPYGKQRMVLGGYKIQEDIGENGGIVCGSKQEAERISRIKGWDWERVDAEQFPPQDMPKVSASTMLDAHDTHPNVQAREVYRNLSYNALKAEVSEIMGKGAPKQTLNSPKDELVKYLVRYKPVFDTEAND